LKSDQDELNLTTSPGKAEEEKPHEVGGGPSKKGQKTKKKKKNLTCHESKKCRGEDSAPLIKFKKRAPFFPTKMPHPQKKQNKGENLSDKASKGNKRTAPPVSQPKVVHAPRVQLEKERTKKKNKGGTINDQ